jgi:hypothetical protein
MLTAEKVQKVKEDLDALIDSAKLLYFGSDEISEDLANELGSVWEVCQDYIEMYENYSRE